MIITILCKVVDNFGDIGVVYRLAKRLRKIAPIETEINLIVDNLDSFNKICSRIKINETNQKIDEIVVYDWNAFDFCYKEFSKNDGEKLSVILECFQCGRPEWMEKILFEDKLERTTQIIMIDYLTAEKYADDFHCLESLTRSKKVQKVNFMPGFTNKTGGLIIDEEWQMLENWNKNGPVLVFTYEKNWDSFVKGIKTSCFNERKFLLAQGRGKESFNLSWNNVFKNQKNLTNLEYLNQNDWDKMMKNCSALVIRGEESMSRACLSGIPFIWHAYPQSDEYQLVKVNALLEKMSVYFTKEEFDIVENVWLCFNSAETQVSEQRMEKASKDFFDNNEKLVAGFRSFASDLRKNGDLVENLMKFISKMNIN